MNVPRGFRLEHGDITPHRPARGAVQPGVADRDLAHGRRRAARDRVRRRLGLRRRAAARAPRRLPPARARARHERSPRCSRPSSSASATCSAGPSPRTSRRSSPRSRAATRPSAAPGSTSAGFPIPGRDTQRPERRGPGRAQRARLRRRRTPRVRGLRSFPKADRTPLALPGPPVVPRAWSASARTSSRSRVWYWLRRRGRPRPEDRRTLLALAAAGPLAFVANELGWMVTELGRQPWVIYGVLRTKDAITTAPGLGARLRGLHARLRRPRRR